MRRSEMWILWGVALYLIVVLLGVAVIGVRWL